MGGGAKLQVLQRFHNRAARIETNRSYNSLTSALMKILKWPTVEDMITCMG